MTILMTSQVSYLENTLSMTGAEEPVPEGFRVRGYKLMDLPMMVSMLSTNTTQFVGWSRSHASVSESV